MFISKKLSQLNYLTAPSHPQEKNRNLDVFVIELVRQKINDQFRVMIVSARSLNKMGLDKKNKVFEIDAPLSIHYISNERQHSFK